MAETYTCEFCNSKFTTKSNLTAHKNRAKKCLKFRENAQCQTFDCLYCNKQFTSSHYMHVHLEKCSAKREQEILSTKNQVEIIYKKMLKEKDTQISKLEAQLREKDDRITNLEQQLGKIAEIGAKKPTTSVRFNTQIINKLAPYDLDATKMHAIVDEKFTEKHLCNKENGLATFATSNLLKTEDGTPKMMCTDTARKKFVYKDIEGNAYVDPNAAHFLESFLPAVKQKSVKIIDTKTGEEMFMLAQCLLGIDTSSLSSRLAEKLTPKKEA